MEKAIEADNYRLAIVPFNGAKYVEVRKLNNYDGPGNSDERYFEDCLYEQSLVSKKFTVITRDKLNKALEELTLQAKDIFDPSTAKRVGKFMGVDLLIVTEGYIGTQGRKGCIGYGRQPFDLNYGVVRITCSLIDVETAEIKAMWNRFDRM
ncbi:MAG: hypothetical protein KAR43_09255 [Deltaproteobacteria bacterium]|nr:hypothetical protein [Deltaproteobacteria bacterium]